MDYATSSWRASHGCTKYVMLSRRDIASHRMCARGATKTRADNTHTKDNKQKTHNVYETCAPNVLELAMTHGDEEQTAKRNTNIRNFIQRAKRKSNAKACNDLAPTREKNVKVRFKCRCTVARCKKCNLTHDKYVRIGILR